MARHHRLALGAVFGTFIGLVFVAALWSISQYIVVEQNQVYQLSHDLDLARRGNAALVEQRHEIVADTWDLYYLAGGSATNAPHAPSLDPSDEPSRSRSTR